jgi:hypothetical protein
MYSVTIVGNAEQCRTEAEISNRDGMVIAVVYEASDGWHTEISHEPTNQNAADFEAIVETTKEKLSHYVNRKGANVPTNMTIVSLSLWLMIKDDGTAMGINIDDLTKS